MDVQDFLDGLLNAQWLQDFLQFLIGVVMVLTNIVLLPVNAFISTFFPDVDELLQTIPAIFENAGTYLAWIFSAFALPPAVITLVTLYYGYVLIVPVALWGFKLGIKWYKAIKG